VASTVLPIHIFALLCPQNSRALASKQSPCHASRSQNHSPSPEPPPSTPCVLLACPKELFAARPGRENLNARALPSDTVRAHVKKKRAIAQSWLGPSSCHCQRKSPRNTARCDPDPGRAGGVVIGDRVAGGPHEQRRRKSPGGWGSLSFFPAPAWIRTVHYIIIFSIQPGALRLYCVACFIVRSRGNSPYGHAAKHDATTKYNG
jgi:hypothetical protein